MMAAWMLYTLLVTLLLVVAGGAAERLARALGAATRLPWAVVTIVSVALSGASLVNGTSAMPVVAASVPGHAGVPPVERPEAGAGPGTSSMLILPRTKATTGGGVSELASRLRHVAELRIDTARWKRYDRILGAACATLAAAGMLLLLVSLIRLRLMTKALVPTDVDGSEVLLSHGLGPAALGFFRRHVVLPYWVLALDSEERRTILLHEQEHAAARDPMLALLGVVAVALQPWNFPLWIAVARLRFAVEADCDARVLRRSRCGPRRYGALLLQVHEHGCIGRVRGRLPVTAFVDSMSHLERRVRRMTDRQPKLRSLPTAAACVVALLVAGTTFIIRVSNAEPAPPMLHARPATLASQSQDDSVTAPAMPEAADTVASIEPRWRSALPAIVSSERDAAIEPSVRVAALPMRVAALPMRIAALSVRWQQPAAAIDRATSGLEFIPETLLVRPSNSMWAMKARITVEDSPDAGRVVITDTLGRMLPSANTLVVEGPIRLILPDARFQLRVESLSGDLMVSTSELWARDRSRGRWVSTMLGRGFRAGRDSAGESVKVQVDGAGVVASHVVPGSQSPPRSH